MPDSRSRAAVEQRSRRDGASGRGDASERVNVSLQDETSNTLEEARVVIPGIQALFGFQLIAVLNERFESLLDVQRGLHLAALLLVALAMALVMAPAAYHRIAERGQVSRSFVDLASRLIAAALVPFTLGVGIDVFVIAWVVLRHASWAAAVAALLTASFLALWFLLPWRRRTHVAHRFRDRRP